MARYKQCVAVLVAGLFFASPLVLKEAPLGLGGLGPASASSAMLPAGPIEHIRGIYLQRAIELATVGSRTVRLTRMTKFRRCGALRGQAEDFNGHIVDAAGRSVGGVGFVAGIVDAVQGCSPAVTHRAAVTQ